MATTVYSGGEGNDRIWDQELSMDKRKPAAAEPRWQGDGGDDVAEGGGGDDSIDLGPGDDRAEGGAGTIRSSATQARTP